MFSTPIQKPGSAPSAVQTAREAFFQPKLTINAPGDQYEQEADAMAERVVQAPQSQGPVSGADAVGSVQRQPEDREEEPVQRKCSDCEKEEKERVQRQEKEPEEESVQRKCSDCEKKEKERVQRQEKEPEEEPVQRQPEQEEEKPPVQMMPLMRKSAGGGYTATPALSSRLSASKGGGSVLPAPTRAHMESAFGSDFSHVRIHTDRGAAEMNAGINARAFTHGSDIYFNSGQYAPESGEGRKLLAHELTHVVQQGNLQRKRIQRHPVFISRHGTQGYLQNALAFYRQWGYAPVLEGVDSIEEVVNSLSVQREIGRVTLVGHGNASALFFAFLSGSGSPVSQNQWSVDELNELPQIEEHQHIITEEAIDTLFDEIESDDESQIVLRRIGGRDNTFVRAMVRWMASLYALRRYPRSIRRQIQSRINEYRIIVFASREAGNGPQPGDFHRFQVAVTSALRGMRFRGLPTGRQVRRSLGGGNVAGSVRRVAASPTFFRNLALVRQRIRNESLIEIQGCRVGANPAYMRAMKNFFRGTNGAPQISAPDIFQYFGSMGFQTLPDSNRRLARVFRDRRVRESFNYWYPIIMGNEPAQPLTVDDFREYLRNGNVLPVRNRLLMLTTMQLQAVYAWLSRHRYRLVQVNDIEQELFSGERSFRESMGSSIIDWLQERRNSPPIFRPDPEYNNHIVSL